MIISASYKTDIPAFYGDWFVNRLRAGYCMMLNPYNRRAYRVDLTPEAADGFVFWTKNLGPFFPALEEVHRRGYPFVVQYTITGYPRALESSVIDAQRAVEYFKQVAATYGSRVAVWRYDTIVFSSITPLDFHLHNFERLAQALQGATDEVVISFAQIYQKAQCNMNKAAAQHNFTWEDLPDEVKRDLAIKLAQIAHTYGMQLSMCGQRQFVAPGIVDASCVDIVRLSDIAGKPIVAAKKAHRAKCGCFASKDIGEYDTCPHGCVYCYAVQNRDLARQNYKAHDPQNEFLLPPKDYVLAEDQPAEPDPIQGKLF